MYGDVKILQDISVNHDDNTVMIAVGDVSRYPGHVSTLNFHDFDTVCTQICETSAVYESNIKVISMVSAFRLSLREHMYIHMEKS